MTASSAWLMFLAVGCLDYGVYITEMFLFMRSKDEERKKAKQEKEEKEKKNI